MPPIDQPEKDFAALLKEYRERARMTQNALGQAIGVDGTYIGKWENRQRYPTSHNADEQSQYEGYVKNLASVLAEKARLTRDEQQVFLEVFLEAWKRCGQQWLEKHPNRRSGTRFQKGVGANGAAHKERVEVLRQQTELQGTALDNETKATVTQHPPEPDEAPELLKAFPVQSQPSRKFVGARVAVAIATVVLALVIAGSVWLGISPTRSGPITTPHLHLSKTTLATIATATWHLQQIGRCKWIVWLHVEHLHPYAYVTVNDRDYTAISCNNPRPVPPTSWIHPMNGGTVDQSGTWNMGIIHNGDFGTYRYVITDDAGDVVHLTLTYGASASAGP